jgi:hypothetical protein
VYALKGDEEEECPICVSIDGSRVGDEIFTELLVATDVFVKVSGFDDAMLVIIGVEFGDYISSNRQERHDDENDATGNNTCTSHDM